jgi:hypothetical protein
MANKEAVFSLRVDTGNSVQDVQSFDKAVNNLNKDLNAVDKTASSLDGIDDFTQRMNELSARIEAGGLTMRDMTQVMKQYQTIAAQAGMESPVGQQALQAAAQLKDEIGDLKAATTALSSDFVALDTTLAGVETGAAVFQGFESAIALTGVESEALVQTMVKLQAVQGAVNAVQTVAKNLNSDAILGIQLRTFWEKAYTKVVGESTGALKGFKIALAATGVGALVVLIGALIANFDDLKAAIFGTNEAADAMRETMDAYRQGAESAIQSTTDVGNAFELAKQGVISKEEALYTYNETLGDTFGRATNLNEAEQLYIKKKDAFIAATAARAQAQALFAKAAEESANALTAQFEDQTNILQKTAAGFTSYFFGVKAGADQLITSQKKEVAEAEKTSKRKAKVYEDAGKAKIKEAETTENANGIISENEKKTQDAIAAKRKEAAEKANKLREEQLKAAKEAWEKEKELSLKYAEDLAKIIENRVKKEDEIIRQSAITKAELMEREAARIDKLRQDEFNDAIGYLEADLINNENNFNAKRDLLEMQRLEELSNKELTEGEITAIEAKYAKQRSDLNKQEQDLKIQAVQNTLTTISNLAQLFAGGSEKQQRKAFQIQKAVSIAQATIDTYKAAQAAYASLAGVPVVGPALGAAAAAAAVSAGLLNVKNIASQKFEGGGSSGSTASAGTASAGATSTQLGGAGTNANLNTQQTNTADLIAQSNEGTPVYVLESDITGTQNKVAMQNKLSVW